MNLMVSRPSFCFGSDSRSLYPPLYVCVQLYFLLSEEVYSYFKNLAASTLMEQSYKNKMEEVALTSTEHLWVESSRIEHLLGQGYNAIN